MSTLPHDLDSERGLLGDLLLLSHRVPEVLPTVTANDFYLPAHGVMFDGLRLLHEAGSSGGPAALGEQLGRTGGLAACGGSHAIMAVASEGSGAYMRHAETVARLASLRRVVMVVAGLRERAMNPMTDPAVLVADAIRDFEGVELPVVGIPDSLRSMDTILDRWAENVDSVRLPWVIPGQLRQGWRCVVVGREGSGKSVLGRQMAMCAAQGVHPFTFVTVPKVGSLLVDLENPVEAIVETAKPIRDKLRSKTGSLYQEHGCWVWHEPGGIDLRQPRWRAEFDRVLAAVQPDLVCLGPMYKAYRTSAGESDELVAAELQNVFDDLRTRHSFALVLEHHAPKGVAGTREMLPMGSSLWLRWPEFGFKLVPGDNKSLTIGRWRDDRIQANWPDELHRGGIDGWPWVGYWEHGIKEF